jgi:hypothetical protein
VPFSKRKSGRGPLQRLSDQRRSLALAGLAVGAVFSAGVLRRKRRGGEAQLEPPSPAAMPPEAPPVAVEPELDDAPINAAPAEPAASSATVEPTTGELSAAEASILSVLAQSGRGDEDRTAIAVATSLERETEDVSEVLRKLGSEGVVSNELQTAAGDKIWAVTERGVRRLGAQS